ncbi:response regulator transcription factor [Desertivirga arenae]|uniref:response regulator transcription factor n=1 Tax=Desertivirga arenae TaxID=2810309 RepID=UPI001A95FFA3|nr:response regulator transcription factor [Pedobacter sp. SYSU D00823]
MEQAKVLLLEDDKTVASQINLFLTNNDFSCDVMEDGLSVLKSDLSDYKLFILDINVPIIDGIQVCRKIREICRETPILMLTAYGSLSDKLQAFNLGADDYIIKPFYFEELLARIQALLRRYTKQPLQENQFIKIDDLEVNLIDKTVFRAGRRIDLTLKEYKLLELLLNAKGRILSKQFIASKVWDINFETGTNTVEVYINFLRSKIDKGFTKKLIHNKSGFGYCLKLQD